MDFIIDKMKDEDWDDVASIFREGIATGNATFYTEAPGWEKWDRNHMGDCRLVAKSKGQVIGWAALSPSSRKSFYAGVAEVSLYVTSSARGLGVGKALLNALIEESQRAGIWTLQGMILRENLTSVALCKKCGFREVGYRERISQMNGVWRDVILMERRSKVVGT
ncbi:MAG: GNAT family N-acetyltransferase [Planctomycetota bacterium]|jgi:phosphinothricin acetyltransferase